MKFRRPLHVLLEWLVKVPAVRNLFYYFQSLLYSRPLLTGFIFLILYTIASLYPLRTGEYTLSISGFELNREYLANAIVTPVYIRLLLVTIFLSVPPFLTLILDLWKVFSDKLTQLEFCSYLLLMFSFILPNLLAYIMFHDKSGEQLTDNMLYTWLAVAKIQQAAITLGMLSAIFGHRAKYATNDSLSFLRFSIEKRTVNIMICLFLSAFFCMLNGKSVGVSTRFRLISLAFFLFAIFLCFTTVCRVFLILFRQAMAEKQFRTHHHVSDFMYTFGFASFIFIAAIFSASAARFGGTEPALLRYLISCVATEVFLICIVSVIPGVKFQRLAALRHEQLETRLNLIRYVSHEMRTPLNTVSMGMNILKEEMMAISGIKKTSIDFTQSQASLRPGKQSFQAGAESKAENLHQSSNTLSNHSGRINSQLPGNSVSERIVLLSEAVINRSQFVHAFQEMLETVQQVGDSCNVAVSTLDDLLTFDKIDENKLVIEVEELNPWRLLLETAKPFTINAGLKNIKFRINLRTQNHNFLKTFCVRGDAFKLAQVIRNLLSNAIKFTPENGTVDVSLSLNETVERGRCVRFSVKDSGAGISKQNMKKLFGQYVQFNAAQLQKGKGSGLGLWITKSIVEMHGGLIAANSEGEGHGTEFYFDVPLHKQAKYSKSGKLRASMIALESKGLEDIMEEGAETLRQFEAGEQGEDKQPSPSLKNNAMEVYVEKNSTPSMVSKPPALINPEKLENSVSPSWWVVLQRIFTFGRSSKIHSNGTEIDNHSPSSSTHRSRESTVHAMTKSFLNYPVKLLTRRLTRPNLNSDESPCEAEHDNDNDNDNENESISTVTFLKIPKDEADIENQNGASACNSNINHLLEGNMIYCPDVNRLEDYEGAEEQPERTASDTSHELQKSNSTGSKKSVTINLKVERIVTEDEHEHSPTAPLTPPANVYKSPSKIVQAKLESGSTANQLPNGEEKPAVILNDFNLLLNASPVTSPSPQRKRAISESPQPTYRRSNNDGLSSPPNGTLDDGKRLRSQTCIETKETHSDPARVGGEKVKPTWDSGLNVLLVDDADSNRKMCRRILTAQKHNVLEAKDGLDCLRVYDESLKNHLMFDLILMDDNMPNLLGYETSKRLRDRGYAGVIIGVTGDVYPENIERFTKNGANEVLGKPLNMAKLKEKFCQFST